MDNADPAPSVAHADTANDAAKNVNATSWIDLFVNGAFIASVSAVVGLALFPLLQDIYSLPAPAAPPSDPAPEIATIDTQALLSEAIAAFGEQMREKVIAPEEMPEKTQAFAAALSALLREYGESGLVVLNEEAVLSAPDDVPSLTQEARRTLQDNGDLPRPARGGDAP